MAKSLEKIQAIKLRKAGHSIRDIAIELKVSRSSVSVWCQGVVLSAKQEQRLYNKMKEFGLSGRMAGALANREKRNILLVRADKQAKSSIGDISRRDLNMLALGLYWGEGSKNAERKFVLTNSDVFVIKCAVRWLVTLGVQKEDMVASVYINQAHEDRLRKVEQFWAKELGFHKRQFRKSVLVKVATKKFYENRERYFGVLRLTVKRSTYLKALIMAKLECVKNQV